MAMTLSLFILAASTMGAVILACVTYVTKTIVAAVWDFETPKRRVVRHAYERAALAEAKKSLPQRTPWMAMAMKDYADSSTAFESVDDHFATVPHHVPIMPVSPDPFTAIVHTEWTETEERDLLDEFADDRTNGGDLS
jgi:hypothetical protein